MLQIGVITKNTLGLEVAVMSQPKGNDDCIFAVQNPLINIKTVEGVALILKNLKG